MLPDIQARKWDTTKALPKAMFIRMPAVAQWFHIQRLSPKNKEALPYICLQADYRKEKQSLIRVWLLVISLATSFLVLPDHFQV
jgi:hypothetical protein